MITRKSPVLSFQLHRLLRVLKLYYQVASILQLPSYSAYYSCTTKSPVLSFQLHRLLHVLKLYHQVASSHPPAPQILRVLKLHYKVASSHLPAPQLVRVLKFHYKVTSSHLPARQILRVLKLYYKVHLSPAFRALDTPDLRRGLRAHRPNRTLACISRTRHARSPQRVARAQTQSHSRLHFAHSTRTISAEGCIFG